MTPKALKVDSRFAVEARAKTLSLKSVEVSEPFCISRKHRKVRIRPSTSDTGIVCIFRNPTRVTRTPVHSGPDSTIFRRDIELTSNDRLDADVVAALVVLEGTGQTAVVSERQSGLPQKGSPLGVSLQRSQAIEDRVGAVDVEVYELSAIQLSSPCLVVSRLAGKSVVGDGFGGHGSYFLMEVVSIQQRSMSAWS